MAGDAKAAGALDYLDDVRSELTQQAARSARQAHRDSVHRTRVATRRLGASIRILRPLLKASRYKDLARALKAIRGSVAELRDLDVMQQHMGERETASSLARKRFVAHLSKRRQELAKEQSKRPAKLQWSRVRRRLESESDRFEALILDAVDKQGHEFIREADRLAAALGGDGRETLHPHALRIAGKALRYSLEMAQAQGLAVSDATLQGFKKMQDDLGLWHDYVVLSECMMHWCLAELEAGEFRRDMEPLIVEAASVMRESETCLEHFARLWRKQRTAVVAQLAGLARAGKAGAPQT